MRSKMRGLLIVFSLGTAVAVAAPPSNQSSFPPQESQGGYSTGQASRERSRGTGVARLSAVSGDVIWKHSGLGDVMSGEAGVPLVGGDSIRTNANSKAEIRLDRSNFLRLNSESEVQLLQIGERAFQVSVVRGDVSYTMMKHGDADVDLTTPGGHVVPKKDGIYRVMVFDASNTSVTVRKGEAEVLTPTGNVKVKSGKMMRVSSNAATARNLNSASEKDTFDDWAKNRDKMMDRERGPGYSGWYASPVVVGAGWGWGWGWPYWGWGPYWGGYWGGPAVRVGVAVPIGGHGGHGGGHRR